MLRTFIVLFILPLLIFPPHVLQASGNSLRKGLQDLQDESKTIIETQEKAWEGSPVIAEISGLDDPSEEVESTHSLSNGQFKQREKEMEAHGKQALERYLTMSEVYCGALREYLTLIEDPPPDGRISLTSLYHPKFRLDRILYKKKRPIPQALPYEKIDYLQRHTQSDYALMRIAKSRTLSEKYENAPCCKG